MIPCKHKSLQQGCKYCDMAQKEPRLRAAWFGSTKLPKDASIKYGSTGSELRAMLSSLGFRACGKCVDFANKMDEWGPDGCKERKQEIVERLREEAKQRGWFTKLRAAGLAALKNVPINPLDPYGSLVDEAIRRSEKMAIPPPKWAYGVTTVHSSPTCKAPGRRDTLLPKTLESLAAAGFPEPRLFVDGASSGYERFNLPVTYRDPAVRAYGNWVLGLLELYIREPQATYYAMFQDDVATGKNLRAYLERRGYPDGGYLNLYTFPELYKKLPKNVGWHTYSHHRTGLGALALVFDQRAMEAMFTHQPSARHMFDRPHDANRGWKAIDGGVVESLRKADVREHVHNPSLVQHTGVRNSTVGNAVHPLADSFRGENFDLLELL